MTRHARCDRHGRRCVGKHCRRHLYPLPRRQGHRSGRITMDGGLEKDKRPKTVLVDETTGCPWNKYTYRHTFADVRVVAAAGITEEEATAVDIMGAVKQRIEAQARLQLPPFAARTQGRNEPE